MNYSQALDCLKVGMLVSRTGWNGKGMFIFLVQGSTFEVSRAPLLGIFPAGKVITYCPHIDMYTADKTVVPWLCSQTDAMAEDWGIVDKTQIWLFE